MKFAKKTNPFCMHTQNYGGNSSDYSGFTGNLEGGPTHQGTRGPKGSNSNSDPGNGYDFDQFTGSYMQDFYKLPTLTKMDQIEIIGELTKGSEVNMTPSKLVDTLNDHIVSQISAKKIIS
jgi:hypothetical protein